MVDKVVSLDALLPGQAARVARITGRSDEVHRLQEFGFRDGTRLKMFRRGNPCIVRVAGGKVCLRADDRLRIMVEPIA